MVYKILPKMLRRRSKLTQINDGDDTYLVYEDIRPGKIIVKL